MTTRDGAPTMRRILGAAIVLSALLIGGCTAMPDPTDREAVEEFRKFNDPAEPTNRAIFEFNRLFDKAILKPLATAYRDFTPQFFQDAVGNVLANLKAPIVFMNDVLQGEAARAGQTVARFVINSTIGVAGIGDPAKDMGLPPHGEDFGQTLAVWGVPEGPYMMLPLLGPSNPRDVVGLVADFLADPLNLWATNTNRDWIVYSRTGVTAIDRRARSIDSLDDLEKSSLDFYATIRSLYRERRTDDIRNGRGPLTAPVPGISFDDGPDATVAVEEQSKVR